MICGIDRNSPKKSGIGLQLLLKYAQTHSEPMAWKILRVLASSSSLEIKMLFLPHIDTLMTFAQKLDGESPFRPLNDPSPDAIPFISIIGILGSLKIPEFDFYKLNEHYGLLQLISTQISSNLQRTRQSIRHHGVNKELTKQISPALEQSDDILLECVKLLGTMLLDGDMVEVVQSFVISPEQQIYAAEGTPSRPSAASGRKSSAKSSLQSIPHLLMDVIQLKQDDQQILLQAISTVHKYIVSSDEICLQMLSNQDIVPSITRLLWDPNEEVRNYAELCLSRMEAVALERGIDGTIGHELKQKRFQFHNAEWIMSVQDEVIDMFESSNIADDKMNHLAPKLDANERFIGSSEFLASTEDISPESAGYKDSLFQHRGEQLQFI
eukprot:Partr_v1_DN28837_c1_g1_i1_m34199